MSNQTSKIVSVHRQCWRWRSACWPTRVRLAFRRAVGKAHWRKATRRASGQAGWPLALPAAGPNGRRYMHLVAACWPRKLNHLTKFGAKAKPYTYDFIMHYGGRLLAD